jgi:hypothetical protein
LDKSKLDRAVALRKDVSDTLGAARKKSAEFTFSTAEKRLLVLSGCAKKVDGFDVKAGLPPAVAASTDLKQKRVYWGKATDALEMGVELTSRLPPFVAKYQKDEKYGITAAPTITAAEVSHSLACQTAGCVGACACLSHFFFVIVCCVVLCRAVLCCAVLWCAHRTR